MKTTVTGRAGKQLGSLKDWGQNRMITTWVPSKKGDSIRARLVARGFEETDGLRSGSFYQAGRRQTFETGYRSHPKWKVGKYGIKWLPGSEHLANCMTQSGALRLGPDECDAERLLEH